MKNLRNLLATVTLMAIIMIGATNANAGLLMSDFAGDSSDPCAESTGKSDDTNWSVIVTGFTSVIVTGFTSVIVTGLANGGDDNNTNCGILLSD